jgi:hypothetical protein
MVVVHSTPQWEELLDDLDLIRERVLMIERLAASASTTNYVPNETTPRPRDRPVKHENPLAREGSRIAGAGFEPATFGL